MQLAAMAAMWRRLFLEEPLPVMLERKELSNGQQAPSALLR
jgi:hypothetical protein